MPAIAPPDIPPELAIAPDALGDAVAEVVLVPEGLEPVPAPVGVPLE